MSGYAQCCFMPSVGLCGLCDTLYCHKHRKNHEHPEPQSGLEREQWLASKLSYSLWSTVTPEGRQWARQRLQRKKMSTESTAQA